jgi:acyl carrier protein
MKTSAFSSRVALLLECTEADLSSGAELKSFATWDSLAILNVIAFFDSELGVQLSFSQVDGCKTITDLAELAGGRICD